MDVTLAGEVVRLRREQGLTQDALAERMGADVVDVSRIEAGDEVGRDLAERACHALSIPQARVLASSQDGWVRPVSPVDEVHASNLARLRGAPMGAGWFVTSDVGAHDETKGWTWDQERRNRWSDRLVDMVLLPLHMGLLLSAVGIAASMMMWTCSDKGSGTVAVWSFSGAFTCYLTIIAVVNSYKPERGFWALRHPQKAEWYHRTAMTEVGYLLTSDGLSQFRLKKDKVLRTDRAARGFRSVDVSPDDDDHVTIEIGHVKLHEDDRRLTIIRWIPRSHDVDAVIADWRAGIEEHGGGRGHSYVVSSAPVLTGRQ